MRLSEMIYLLSWKDIGKIMSLKKNKSYQYASICSFTHQIHAEHYCVSGTELGAGDKVTAMQA